MWSFRKVIRPVYANGWELLSGWFEIYNMLEKILKIKSLLKEDIDIDEEIKISCPGEMKIMKLKTDIDSLGISLDTRMILPNKREVVHITGYPANKYLKKKPRVAQE